MPRQVQPARVGSLLGLSLVLGLAGCANTSSPPAVEFAAATPNPIQISRTRLVHKVSFPQQGAALESIQLAALFGFIAAQGVGPADTVIVERGAGPLDLARAEALQSSLQNAGLHPAMVTDAALGAGVARVVVERYVAIAPDCPNWSRPPGPNFQNYDQRNFGCADSKNLAAMIADPKDLAMGAAALPPQVGDPVTHPVLRYRTGPAPAGAAAGGEPGAPSGGPNPAAGTSGAGAGAGLAGSSTTGSASGPTGPS